MYQIEYFKTLVKEAKQNNFKYPLTINTDKGKYYIVAKTIDYVKYAFVISSKKSTTYGKNFEGLIAESYFEENKKSIYRILKNKFRYLIEQEIGNENTIIWQDFGESTKGTVARIYIAKEVMSNELKKHTYLHLEVMEKLLKTIQKYIQIINNNAINFNNDENLIEDIENIIENKLPINTEKENLIKCRVGQGEFRDKLIKYWKGCSVTKYNNYEILIASHIKPWRDSSHEERLDPFNGLLLTPNLDKLFDKGFISFNDNGNILISRKLINFEVLGITKDMKINIDEKHKKYLKFHRSDIFDL